MWMSTRAMRSKGKGASVRNTAVFPAPLGPPGPVSEASQAASAAAPATASASLRLCIVVSPEAGVVTHVLAVQYVPADPPVRPAVTTPLVRQRMLSQPPTRAGLSRMSDSDAALVARTLGGDLGAYAALMARYRDKF